MAGNDNTRVRTSHAPEPTWCSILQNESAFRSIIPAEKLGIFCFLNMMCVHGRLA